MPDFFDKKCPMNKLLAGTKKIVLSIKRIYDCDELSQEKCATYKSVAPFMLPKVAILNPVREKEARCFGK